MKVDFDPHENRFSCKTIFIMRSQPTNIDTIFVGLGLKISTIGVIFSGLGLKATFFGPCAPS